MSQVCALYIIRFALILWYTSVQSYKLLLDDFRSPSLSLLRKAITGDTDAAKSTKLLKDEEKVSSDVATSHIWRDVSIKWWRIYGRSTYWCGHKLWIMQRYRSFHDHWCQTKHPIHYKICTGKKYTCRLVKEWNYWMS